MDKVVHFEIPFENKDRAMKFYTESFGWQVQTSAGCYVMANTVATRATSADSKQAPIDGGLFERPKGSTRGR